MNALNPAPLAVLPVSETQFESDQAYLDSQEFIDDLRREREFFERRAMTDQDARPIETVRTK